MEKTPTVNVAISRPLHKLVRLATIKQEMPVRQFVESALRVALKATK